MLIALLSFVVSRPLERGRSEANASGKVDSTTIAGGWGLETGEKLWQLKLCLVGTGNVLCLSLKFSSFVNSSTRLSSVSFAFGSRIFMHFYISISHCYLCILEIVLSSLWPRPDGRSVVISESRESIWIAFCPPPPLDDTHSRLSMRRARSEISIRHGIENFWVVQWASAQFHHFSEVAVCCRQSSIVRLSILRLSRPHTKKKLVSSWKSASKDFLFEKKGT